MTVCMIARYIAVTAVTTVDVCYKFLLYSDFTSDGVYRQGIYIYLYMYIYIYIYINLYSSEDVTPEHLLGGHFRKKMKCVFMGKHVGLYTIQIGTFSVLHVEHS